VDAGLETIDIDLPAVISVDLRLNEPRFVKLPDIMKAKRKPLDVIPLDELGVTVEANLNVTHHAPPDQREKGIMVEDTAQLVQELKNRGLI
jgi:electron transfer flavoprotein beta subunit